MEGWLTGIFTLAGVLAGGLFTYLGMKKQLKQQRELDSRQWRRKVRSKPLLKLRDELAVAAVKYARLAIAVYPLKAETTEATKKELQECLDDINVYIQAGSLDNIRCMLSDKEIINRIDEIIKDYRNSYSDMADGRDSGAEKLKKAMQVFERNKARIIEVQELINKRLEGL